MFERPSNFESFVHIVMSCLSKHGDFVPVQWIKEHTGTNHYDAFLSRMMSIAKDRARRGNRCTCKNRWYGVHRNSGRVR